MPSTSINFDQLVSLAFTLNSAPGSYACILGAGISIPSGVPSAWGVQKALLEQLAAIDGHAPADPFLWYQQKYDSQPTYEGLLELLAPTQHERQHLLRGFFEPTELESELGEKQPTDAHRAIARLVASGSIRMILTLNFDRLMETALKDLGIEPTVVSHPSDIGALAPLHTLQALIVHLHGDYLNPTAMLNTKLELAQYPQHVDAFLDKVLSDYGLLLVGWSATYDPALRRALTRNTRRVYTPYWVEPGQLSLIAEDLRSLVGAVKVTSDANVALGRLADAVQAIGERESRHPLVPAVAVETAKRYLAGKTTAVQLHDLLHQEFDQLHDQKDILLSSTGTESSEGGAPAMISRIEEAALIPTALLSTAAYWGNDQTDKWWLREIVRFTAQPTGPGLSHVRRLPHSAAMQFFYGAGVSAIASGRLDLVHRLLNTSPEDATGSHATLAQLLAPDMVMPADPRPGRRLHDLVAPLFIQHLKLGTRNFEESWETFELLRLVESTYAKAQTASLLEAALGTADSLEKALQRMETANSGNNLDEHDAAEEGLKRIRLRHRRNIDQIADTVWVWRPYLTIQNTDIEVFRSTIGQKIQGQLERQGTLHRFAQAGFAGGHPLVLKTLVAAVDLAIGRIGYEAAIGSLPGRSGTVPDNFRLGDS